MTRNTKELIAAIIIGLLITFFIFKKCSTDNKSRDKFRRTHKVANNLWTETFCVFGQGAFGGDVDSKWLTDSANFRIFLGAYDQIEGGIFVECFGDSVYVTQRPDAISGNPKGKSKKTIYKLSELKQKQNLNDY